MDLGRGILRRCDCGAATVVLTSNTARNPEEGFIVVEQFRVKTMFSNGLMKHMMKSL
uniref:Uncharacterized protein n=1 Tax=Brassica oleracea TaxID=3712 RepID=A0A3P6DD69_BRAOL|nr:unnamed protein product [Brassica oleracea]